MLGQRYGAVQSRAPGRSARHAEEREGNQKASPSDATRESQWEEPGEAEMTDKAIVALREVLREPKRKDVKRPARARSETEFQAILNLEKISCIAGRAESQDRIGRLVQIYPSINGVQVRDVYAVEEIEEVETELGADALVEADLPRYSHVESGETRTLERVPAQDARTIGERIAIAVRVRAGEDVVASAALCAQ
jgi:hypothetical protein